MSFPDLKLKVYPLKATRDGLRLGFDAPADLKILRDDAINKHEQKTAA